MDYGLSDIKDVETLIDEFNERASDLSNTLQYNSNPLLKLINCTMDKEQLQEMINSRCIQLPEGAQAEYLVWDQQINAIEKHLERLNDCILTFSCTPKLYKDNDEGNPMSGISIKMKFSGADLKANNKERNYRLGIKKRIRLISKILALTENKVYNYNDVDIIFNRSIPQNLLELADIVVKLKGTVSDETLLGILPFVIDVTTEMDRVAKEKSNQPDTTNTDQVK
jgi:SPP1 family phage portal protein